MVVHAEKNGNVYANIASAAQLPKGMVAPAMFNKGTVIDVDSTPFEEIEALPDFIKDKMKSSEEYKARVRHGANISGGVEDPKPEARPIKPKILGGPATPVEDINPDDIPFLRFGKYRLNSVGRWSGSDTSKFHSTIKAALKGSLLKVSPLGCAATGAT